MFYLAGVVIACFLVALLLFKKEKKAADKLLLLWMSVMALHMLLFYGHYSGFSYRYPHTLGLSFPLPLLHGVFLYFYMLTLTNIRKLRIKEVTLHLLPPVVIVILALPFYRLPAERKVEIFQNNGLDFEWFSLVLVPMIVVAGLSYSLVTIAGIRKHRQNILINFSNTDNKMLKWLESLSIGLGVIWFLVIFFDDAVVFAGVASFVLFIGFFGINQAPVFYSDTTGTISAEKEVQKGEMVNVSQEEQKKYAKSSMDLDRLVRIVEEMEALMKVEKLYQNPELTLAQLAERLKISPNHLSQAINSVTGDSFYKYVNDYRIKEFLKLAALPENRKFTFLALAFDCGFNSKTTFNKYFKLFTGKTPSEYFGDPGERS